MAPARIGTQKANCCMCSKPTQTEKREIKERYAAIKENMRIKHQRKKVFKDVDF